MAKPKQPSKRVLEAVAAGLKDDAIERARLALREALAETEDKISDLEESRDKIQDALDALDMLEDAA